MVLLFLASVGWLARLVASLFSAESERRLREHRRFHAIWFAVIPLFAVVWIITTNPFIQFGPPTWWERRTQRQEVLSRVQSTGGWETLKKDCRAFAEQHQQESGSSWYGNDTNGLPATLVVLQPKRVEFYSPAIGTNFNDSGFPIVRITVFGANVSGARGTPWMGFDVICGECPKDYLPKRNRSSDRDWNYRKVAEGVFEFY